MRGTQCLILNTTHALFKHTLRNSGNIREYLSRAEQPHYNSNESNHSRVQHRTSGEPMLDQKKILRGVQITLLL